MRPVLWMRLGPARRWLAAHHDHVAGLFASSGWTVVRQEAPPDLSGAAVAVMSDPWIEPLPELARALAGARGDAALWRVPSVNGLPGAQGWDAATGPFTLEDYRRRARVARSDGSPPPEPDADWWTGFAVAPAPFAGDLLSRGWPPRRETVALVPGVKLYRYSDPADHDRHELDPFLPDLGGLWVDVGCGTGRLAARLRRGDRRVVGIEPDPELARCAAERLDQVIALPVESALAELAREIRCAVLADVLEHTTDPAAVLRALRGHLAADGRLVLSFPNAAWAPIVRALAAGRWDPTLAGNQARDHFALFTPGSFAALAAECGFAVERLEPLGDDLPAALRIWSRFVAWTAGGDPDHLGGAQWVAVLRARAAVPEN